MAERAAWVDLVVVSAPDLGARDVSLGNQVGKDPLRSAFGDPDLLGYVACTRPRVARDAEEHVRVIGEEAPGARLPCSGLGVLLRHARVPSQ